MCYRRLLFPAALVVLAAMPAPAGANGVTLYSEASLVWHGDVEGMLATHAHGGEALLVDGPLALRGAFAFAQDATLAGPPADRTRLEGSAEIVAALASDLTLRAGFSVDYRAETASLALAGLAIDTMSDRLSLSGDIGVTRLFGATQISLGAGLGAERTGDTAFAGIALPAQRLGADADRLFASIGISHPLSGELALRLDGEASRLTVPPQDRLTYGRQPADRLRLAGGLAFAAAQVSGTLLAGADLLTATGEQDEAFWRPYGEAGIALVLRERFTLALAAGAGTRLARPRDGFADWGWDASLRADWQLDPRLTLFAVLSAEGGAMVLAPLPLPLAERWGARAGARIILTDGITLGAEAGMARVTAAVTESPENRFHVALSLRTTL